MHLIAVQKSGTFAKQFRPKHSDLQAIIKHGPFRNAEGDKESTTICAFILEFIQGGANVTLSGVIVVKRRVSSELRQPHIWAAYVKAGRLCVYIRMAQISVYYDYGMFMIARVCRRS